MASKVSSKHPTNEEKILTFEGYIFAKIKAVAMPIIFILAVIGIGFAIIGSIYTPILSIAVMLAKLAPAVVPYSGLILKIAIYVASILALPATCVILPALAKMIKANQPKTLTKG